MKAKFLTVFVLFLFCGVALSVTSQEITVKGKVSDESGAPIAGCTVSIEGTTNGVITDVNGEYSIETEMGKTLVFNFIGYETLKQKVNGKLMNVSLKPRQETLDEVTVVAFGRQKNASVKRTGSAKRRETEMIQAADMADIAEDKLSVSYVSSPYDALGEEEYTGRNENGFKFVKDAPLSTFSIDVDASSYSNMRRLLNQGQLPPKDAIRTEELVNYFTYDYKKPTGNDPVKIAVEASECPWNGKHRLVRIALKAKEFDKDKLPASNLVFLIDVSGSMEGPNRLGLVKSSLKLLTNNLRGNDRVAIVVYAGQAGEVLPSTSGDDKQKIFEALERLEAGGSTAGGAGIELAYKIAEKNFVKGGNNRIILCTDGDFNVGVSSNEGLEKLIEQKRKTGVFLTVLGYGMGNYKDSKMQILAEKGNGNHAYIDNIQEANRVLVQEFGSTLYTVAKDVKLQIEFNPAQAQAYRLIGYESRLLQDKDFNDDTKDAGEMGSGHCVTAFYEIVPVGVTFSAGNIDPLKYQEKNKKEEKSISSGSNELLTVKLRYKDPDGDTSRKMELPFTDSPANSVSSDFQFASAVAMFGQILIASDFKGNASYDKVISLAKSAVGNDEQGYRKEFIRLVESAKGLDKK